MADATRNTAAAGWDQASLLTAVTGAGMVLAMVGTWVLPDPVGAPLALAGLAAVYAAGGIPAGLRALRALIFERVLDIDLLMVVAADNLLGMDSEVFAPGRFDVKIPVFPPNQDERAQMILRYLTHHLEEDAVLMKILEYNEADHKPFWTEYSSKMKLFSNTMVIDFTQSVKKRLRNHYLKVKTHQFKIEKSLLEHSLIEAATKLTDEYLNSVQQFIFEVSANDYDAFTKRIEKLKHELETYKVVEMPRRQIGFHHN